MSDRFEEKKTKEAVINDYVGGISIQHINVVQIMVSALIIVVIMLQMHRMTLDYEDLTYVMGEYVGCTEDIRSVIDTSALLTTEVRLYEATGDASHAMEYYTEVLIRKTRDNALERLKQSLSEEDYRKVEALCAMSRDLEQFEKRAIYLLSLTDEYERPSLPLSTYAVLLTEEERNLNDAGRIKLANELLYGREYRSRKDAINEAADDCFVSVSRSLSVRQVEAVSRLNLRVVSQVVMCVVIAIIFLINMAVNVVMIVYPIRSFMHDISGDRPLEITGSSEMRRMAALINYYKDKYRERTDYLKYRADHDQLTGVFNRMAFEAKCERIKNNGMRMALAMIDIDHFKKINDTLGHNEGDRILRLLADTLTAGFRSTDEVYRMGGDEFVLIMHDISEEQKEIIKDKIGEVNRIMQKGSPGEVKATVSVGVAFSDNGYTEDILKRADSAMYISKRTGPGLCTFVD